MKKKKRYRVNPTRIVVGTFLAVILVGMLLLMLPISSRGFVWTNPLTALFTATSATCVTGLVLVDTWLHWSYFGQAVILLMIQIGGLGFMTMITMVSLVIHRRISISERLIMVSTLNLNDMRGVVRMVKHVLLRTVVLEASGAVLLAIRFVPRFGWGGGLWRSVFTAISAFCNAGFDLMGASGPFSSMTDYVDDPLVNVVLMGLIIVGGLGFFVWEDVLSKRGWKRLSLYTKLVLKLSAILIVAGAVYFVAAEWSNPATLGGMPVPEKLLAALFQSVTLRTAGFNTIDQGALTESATVISCILMTIGGSSGSTAGGVKTVTIWVLLRSLISGLTGREKVVSNGRTIRPTSVLNAIQLVLMAMLIEIAGSLIICTADKVPYLAALYETCSAMGTVGLTTGITAGLSPFSHGVLILIMFLGRVGILSIALGFFTRRGGESKITYPSAHVMIG